MDEENQLPVLDKGYVRLVDVMGSDLSVVNAARVSFNKETRELREKDKRLIRFLAENGHTSPFRHAMATFEVYAPLMVARQWWKYVVGSDHIMDAWNESSRRYVTEEPMFYVPDEEAWRSKPEDAKQGSGWPLPYEDGFRLSRKLRKLLRESTQLYQEAIEAGVAPEQARLFLPAYSMYVRWRWTASLQSICHFLKQRLAYDAQAEITQYAEAVYELIHPHFPVSVEEVLSSES